MEKKKSESRPYRDNTDPTGTGVKKCRKCGQVKPIAEFHNLFKETLKHGRTRYKNSKCKACVYAQNKEVKQRDREKFLAYHKRYNDLHKSPEKLAKRKLWYLEHRDEVLAKRRKAYREHKAALIAKTLREY